MNSFSYFAIAAGISCHVNIAIFSKISSMTIFYDPIIWGIAYEQDSVVDLISAGAFENSGGIFFPVCGTKCDNNWAILKHFYDGAISNKITRHSRFLINIDQLVSEAKTIVKLIVLGYWCVGILRLIRQSLFQGFIYGVLEESSTA